jgi:hypothetical protein
MACILGSICLCSGDKVFVLNISIQNLRLSYYWDTESLVFFLSQYFQHTESLVFSFCNISNVFLKHTIFSNVTVSKALQLSTAPALQLHQCGNMNPVLSWSVHV